MDNKDNEITELERELRFAVRNGEMTEEEAEEVYDREVAIIEEDNWP